MSNTPDYDAIRRPEHSTLGDSVRCFERDPDVFTAGVQYALDRMLSRAESLLRPVAVGGIGNIAAGILTSVHAGALI